ncbi:MAG: FMN-binding protein [Prevotellaceae bacterium]|nr:FMN-binding protein [Prevotella sp.]MDD7258516.1 FMN-binding protein [Prevotellaceae bacterium]MDY6131540.1 FMN-binding protein [Prevotella sp.]
MKKQVFSVFVTGAALCMAAAAGTDAMAGKTKTEVITKMADGTHVVNTATITGGVKGYKGNTPLKIYIKANKVVKVEALENQESPRYFQKVKDKILNSWNGMKVGKALTAEVDGVSGATLSSNAVKANVKAGLTYYRKNR